MLSATLFPCLQVLYSYKCNWSHILARFQATKISCNFVSLCLCKNLVSMFTPSVSDVYMEAIKTSEMGTALAPCNLELLNFVWQLNL